MAFSDDAAPTRANIKNRLQTAAAALHSASALVQRGDLDVGLLQRIGQAQSWTAAAETRLAASKGKKR